MVVVHQTTPFPLIISWNHQSTVVSSSFLAVLSSPWLGLHELVIRLLHGWTTFCHTRPYSSSFKSTVLVEYHDYHGRCAQ